MGQRSCAVEGCMRKRAAKGFCDAHYRRWRRDGDAGPAEITRSRAARCMQDGCDRIARPDGWCFPHRPRQQSDVCAVEGCGRPPKSAQGWCSTHYSRWLSTGDPGVAAIRDVLPAGKYLLCTADGCDRPHMAKGYCDAHYRRWRKTGTPLPATPQRQSDNHGECQFSGCGRRVRSVGLCGAHYLQRFHGKPLTPLRPRVDTTARDEHGRKQCFTCAAWLPEGDFYGNAGTRDRLASNCKRCHRDRVVRKAYGISLDEYEAMLKRQDGRCVICGTRGGKGRKLAVDHDHKTGAVRALLCSPCNTSLGLMMDDPVRLRAAAAYLESPP